MLLVTCFTFFGLSAIQSLSYFSKLFDGHKIVLNINAQEEENETSNNEEAKAAKEKLDRYAKIRQFAIQASLRLGTFDKHIFFPSAAYIEVITPPPEA
jgi:predicted aminopeptidase